MHLVAHFEALGLGRRAAVLTAAVYAAMGGALAGLLALRIVDRVNLRLASR